MSADKRAVFTDALETLGTFITEKEKRDAIHLAVEPVVAAEELSPGDHVTLNADNEAIGVPANTGLGIVDPFLNHSVPKGTRFWLVVYPRQIKSLRHVWEHPGFPPSEDLLHTAESVSGLDSKLDHALRFMQELSAAIERPIVEILCAAQDYLSHGEYYRGGDSFVSAFADDEFWDAYEALLLVRVPEEDRGNFFSCSC